MKNIIISQSLHKIEGKGYFSQLNLEWFIFAKKNNFNLIPIPYFINKNILNKLRPDGIILSGGNDIFNLVKKTENKIRDDYEKKIYLYARKKKIPLLSVCRGFQFIMNYHKSKIFKLKNHVRVNHNIILNLQIKNIIKKKKINVNSFHNFGIKKLPKGFISLAGHEDGSIELAKHENNKILCMMFHPERKSLDQSIVVKIFKQFFKI